MFWVISVYFNIRNTLPKSGTFLLGHPVYIYIYRERERERERDRERETERERDRERESYN